MVGGPNPQANPRLKAAIERALDANLSSESIRKNIEGLGKDEKALVENEYEFFAERGLKIIIHVLTDNVNRALSNINNYVGKLGGTLAKKNSVKKSFSDFGFFTVKKTPEVDEITIMDLLKQYKLVDVEEVSGNDALELIVERVDYYNVKAVLEQNQIEISASDLSLIPNETINADEGLRRKLEKFFAQCNQDGDIQWVVTNVVGADFV